MLPSKSLLDSMLSLTKARTVLIPPSILSEMSIDAESLKVLSKMDRVIFCGGPLGYETGKVVSKVTTLTNFIGVTES